MIFVCLQCFKGTVPLFCSFCKGRTLHSFVRDPKISLDINKTRQIAQEIIKVRAYILLTDICFVSSASARALRAHNGGGSVALSSHTVLQQEKHEIG